MRKRYIGNLFIKEASSATRATPTQIGTACMLGHAVQDSNASVSLNWNAFLQSLSNSSFILKIRHSQHSLLNRDLRHLVVPKFWAILGNFSRISAERCSKVSAHLRQMSFYVVLIMNFTVILGRSLYKTDVV